MSKGILKVSTFLVHSSIALYAKLFMQYTEKANVESFQITCRMQLNNDISLVLSNITDRSHNI